MQPETPEHLNGQIERVTFYSEESGFSVLRVKLAGKRELATVVGILPNVTAGEWLDASGRWVVDPQHGPQFKADRLTTAHPNTRKGIEKYLASGMIKGIGPAFAARLVGAFGLSVFDVIEKEPNRLQEVDGIGPIRREKITRAWDEQKAVREIMVFLHSHGVGTSRAFRIYRTYGDEAIPLVKDNPYRLAKEIWGIGFKSADSIAESLGITKESNIRARAGVEYVMRELTDEGHCAFPRKHLIERASKMLDIPAGTIEKAISHQIEAGDLTQQNFRGHDLIYLSALDLAERLLADNLMRLSRLPHPTPPIHIPKAIEWVQRRLGIALAPAQREALDKALASKVLVITGGPGVGKTTLVNSIASIFSAKKLAVKLAAPTGRAAKRLSEATGMDARTIHRLLEFEPSTGKFKHDRQKPLKGDVFIIDESSMIDLNLAHQLVRAIPLHAALIFVGDVDQLPSVGPGCVLRDVIDSHEIEVCMLTQVFRQAAESRIITNAHRINAGEQPQSAEDKPGEDGEQIQPSDFYFIECEEPERCVQLILRLVQERIPRRFGFDPVNDIQVLTPMQRGELGARNLNQVLQNTLNPSSEGVSRFGWQFSAGDKVMQTVNNYDKEVFNGDIGTIYRIDTVEQELIVRFEDRHVHYGFGELDELVLSYAITIHKSQGSEYPAVVIPIHTQHFPLLQRNLLYTAVTRGKELVTLVGTKKAMAIALKRTETNRRVTTLRERIMNRGR